MARKGREKRSEDDGLCMRRKARPSEEEKGILQIVL